MSVKVTIGVITYNSGKFIKETLDSCLLQLTDQFDIELFVSDDASQDDTAEIVSTWLKEHGDKFTSNTFIAQPENLGAKENANFIVSNAQGDYLRLLEGDDILVGRGIEELVIFVNSNSDIKCVFTDRLIFTDDIMKARVKNSSKNDFAKMSSSRQFKMLLTGMQANGPSLFYDRQTFIDCGAYVGTRNVADLPTLLNLTQKGVKLYMYSKPLLYYRKHEMSISSSNNTSWQKTKYEFKKYRNETFLTPDVSFILRLYCRQDFLKSKKKVYALSYSEWLVLTFGGILSRIAKIMNFL